MSQAPRPDDYYSRGGPPPPGQGHYNQYPEAGYVPYQDTYNRGPPRDSYPPPPRDADPFASRESFASGPPRSRYTYGGSERESDRPYAPSEPRPHSFNQVQAYDDNKAEAGWQEQDRRQQSEYYTHRSRRSTSSAGYGYGRGRDYDDDDYYYSDNEDDYADRRRRQGNNSRRSRRYSDDDSMTEKVLRYPSDPKKGGRDFFGSSEGERGLATNLLGGAGGALLGNKFGRGGAIGTIGGAAVGAVLAQALERQYVKRKEEKEKVIVRRSGGDAYAVPVEAYSPRGRDMDDVRDAERPSGLRERLRSLSRSARARTRSRTRSRPARRSPSVESDERYHERASFS